MVNSKKLNSDIYVKRVLLGLTTEELGNKCGLTKQAISYAELHEEKVSKSNLLLIHKVLGECFEEWKPTEKQKELVKVIVNYK